jgi:hypothetical protein
MVTFSFMGTTGKGSLEEGDDFIQIRRTWGTPSPSGVCVYFVLRFTFACLYDFLLTVFNLLWCSFGLSNPYSSLEGFYFEGP